MSRDDRLRIADICDAAQEIAHVVDVGREKFLADPIRVRAAERLLEIVGEAVNSLTAETTERFPEVEWAEIARLRIVLAHHYHRVDPEQVWIMATVDVPEVVVRLRGWT